MGLTFMASSDISDRVQRRHDMMNFIRRFVDHPAPHATLGIMCIVVALAQNEPSLMFLGLWGLIIAIWNYEESI